MPRDGRPWIDDPCPVCGEKLVEVDGYWGCEFDREEVPDCPCPTPYGDCQCWMTFVGCKICDWQECEAYEDPEYTNERKQEWEELTSGHESERG